MGEALSGPRASKFSFSELYARNSAHVIFRPRVYVHTAVQRELSATQGAMISHAGINRMFTLELKFLWRKYRARLISSCPVATDKLKV